MAALRLRIVTRIGKARSPLRSFLLGSGVVHVVLVIAMAVLPSLRARPSIPDDFVFVELATLPSAAPASVEPGPTAPVPPAPEPEPEGARIEPDPVVEKPEPRKPEPKKPETTKPEKKPDPAPPESRVPPKPEVAPGGPPGAGADGPGGGVDDGGSIAALEGGDSAFAWYRASVTAALYGRWQRPILSGLREPAEVRVGFLILRNGMVRDLEILDSSGVPSLDRSALRAVTDAAPLPPLPNSWRDPSLPAAFVFRLYPGDS